MTPPSHSTLDDWITHEALPFSLDDPAAFTTVVAKIVAALDDAVELLGFGEALHGGEDILLLRNRLFQHLAEAHGYSAIAFESSFPRARVVNDYVLGRGPESYETVRDSGFSHGFGWLEANRELMEWMRGYNADPAHRVKLHFYGFDQPGVTAGPASPRQVLFFVLDYLAALNGTGGQERRERIDQLLGPDARWENPMTWRDPAQSPDLLASATSLRIETEEIISELRTRGPELIARGGRDRYREAVHDAAVARHLLTFFAVLARESDYAPTLAVRDALMADNLAYIVERERSRGKVLVFAHNAHLQRGKVNMQMGTQSCSWWPAGAHVHEQLGPRYAVIGSAVGASDANGIGLPEPGTLEARLTAAPGPVRFLPTHTGQAPPVSMRAELPVRSGSTKNPSYLPLTPQSLTDFDWLAVLDATPFQRRANEG